MSVTFGEGLSALRVLKTFVNAELPNEYTGDTDKYGTPRCALEDDEPQAADQVGGPVVLLALESDDRATWSTPAKPRNEVVARFDVLASEFAGAQTGDDNPEGTDALLSAAVIRIIENNVAALEALGLKRPSIRSERETIQQDEGQELHANPHRVRFTYQKS